MNRRNFLPLCLVLAAGLLTPAAPISAQSAGDSITLQYGVVKKVEQVQAESRHARGAVLGGIGGAIIADDHPGLGALAGGLIGAGIEGHRTGKHLLLQYSVSLMDGSEDLRSRGNRRHQGQNPLRGLARIS